MNELEAYKLEGLSHLSHIPSRISILRLAIWGGRPRWREQWSKACGMVIMTILPHTNIYTMANDDKFVCGEGGPE